MSDLPNNTDPLLQAQTKQPPKVADHEFASITIRYKSGKSYRTDTTVGDARKRALTAIERKSATWIKVTIPNPYNTDQMLVSVWSRKDKWIWKIETLPATKDRC